MDQGSQMGEGERERRLRELTAELGAEEFLASIAKARETDQQPLTVEEIATLDDEDLAGRAFGRLIERFGYQDLQWLALPTPVRLLLVTAAFELDALNG